MKNISQKILIVDDDPDIGTMIKTMLEYHGFDVAVTEQAEKAEDLVGSNDYGLLIMDMLLSGMNGTDICTRIKAHYKIPIIMISAHPNAKDICAAAGADDFISKPFDMQEMVGKIKQYVQPKENSL
jgi:DNA-binding response OmpR family regulator